MQLEHSISFVFVPLFFKSSCNVHSNKFLFRLIKPAATEEALKKRSCNRDAQRKNIKESKLAKNPLVRQIVKKALAAQVAKLRPVLLQRKGAYDRARDFDERAVRNDKDTWKKKYLDLMKTSKISEADMEDLQHYRKVEMWVKAHAHPPTRDWLCHLKKYGPPKAKWQES